MSIDVTQIVSHRNYLSQLERHLIEKNLLQVDQQKSTPKPTARPSNLTNHHSSHSNTAVSMSTSSTSSSSRTEKHDALKSVTEEFQKKIDSQQPLLFPPKDYDAVHASHGHIDRAQAWKSTDVSKFSLLLHQSYHDESIAF
jgi:hypothetical protein